MLEVVHRLEEAHRHEGLEQEGREGDGAEGREDPEGEAPLEDEAVQHAIPEHAPVEEGHRRVAEAALLEAPGALHLRRHGAEVEALEGLAEAGGGRLQALGCGLNHFHQLARHLAEPVAIDAPL